jgi:hypothetical protein
MISFILFIVGIALVAAACYMPFLPEEDREAGFSRIRPIEPEDRV